MKKLLIIPAILILNACGSQFPDPMTNDQIIMELKKCKQEDLSAEKVKNYNGETVYVECDLPNLK